MKGRSWPTVFGLRGLVLVDATDTSGTYSGLDLVYDTDRQQALGLEIGLSRQPVGMG